jgi:D-alanyl-D-alanine carboxypeptidase
MKTGFICSSGFNVVATAKRGDKHLIVVLFGSRSSRQRAEDAARLFERGFGGPLSLAHLFAGDRQTLDQVTNVAVGPVDMREEMCDRRRRRGKKPASETDLDEDSDDPEAKAALLNNGTKQSLLIDMPPSMPPIRVWTGSKEPPVTAATDIKTRKQRSVRTKKTKATADIKAKTKAKTKATEAKAKPKAVTGDTKKKDTPKPATTAPEQKPAPTRVSTPAPAPRPGG